MTKTTLTTDAEKARILNLARQGRTRSSIAKEVGRSLSTVAKICRDAGVEPAVVLSAPFVEARALSVKERQVAARERKFLIDELADAKVLAALQGTAQWQTRVKTQGGGERFEVVDFIPPDDFRNATSSGAALASSIKNLAPLETGGDTAAAESVIDKLMAGFVNAATKATKPEPIGDEEAATE